MLNISFEEAVLLFWCGICIRIEGIWLGRIMVVVAPFREVVCEFEAGDVGRGILEVDND